jgi:hypothetical protein
MKPCNALMIFFMLLFFSLTVGAAEAEEKVSVKPYGFIKLDTLYETGNSSHGNYILWAKDPGQSSGLFYVTARETRLGLAIKGIKAGSFKVSGKVEVDFHSSGSEENKPYNFMRHAYLEISNGSFSIIAGQTWDIISPLNPSTLNYSVLWGGGNIGYRRPQLSLRQELKSGKSVFTLQAGIFRTIAADYDNDGIEDGSASGFPTFQGRIAGKFALGKKSSLQLGFSGHYGKSTGTPEFSSNSVNVDVLLVFSPGFKLLAEYFSGKNLGTYLGAAGQSVNLDTGKEIEARGFYINAVINPSKTLQLSAGWGRDDPEDATLSPGNRAKNTALFGNLRINLGSLGIGLEISHWSTAYLAMDRQETTRFQNSWILTF